MFLDEIRIRVRGGKGGAGCLSFRREKFVPRGGPDGGDGGDGGSVVLVADATVTSLHPLRGRGIFAAANGGPGGPGNRTGHRGADLEIRVPVGTQVLDAARGNLLADLTEAGARAVVARGGRRGRGNKAFATPTDRAPRRAEPGTEGEERELLLVLKLIADAGLVGLPNAGKSTLLSVLSAARPKIAAYPFTTLRPCLGLVPLTEFHSIVLADIPGLIEGAAEGRGLGHRFLRHVERTRVLVHLVDCSSTADRQPATALAAVRGELEAYSPALAERPRLLVATKVEDEDARRRSAELEALAREPVIAISSVTGFGLDRLKRALLELIPAVRESRS